MFINIKYKLWKAIRNKRIIRNQIKMMMQMMKTTTKKRKMKKTKNKE